MKIEALFTNNKLGKLTQKKNMKTASKKITYLEKFGKETLSLQKHEGGVIQNYLI